MGMLPLLLGLDTSSGGVGDIDAVLGHDGEAREPDFGGLLGLLLGIPLWLLRHPRIAYSAWGGQAGGGVCRIAERR